MFYHLALLGARYTPDNVPKSSMKLGKLVQIQLHVLRYMCFVRYGRLLHMLNLIKQWRWQRILPLKCSKSIYIGLCLTLTTVWAVPSVWNISIHWIHSKSNMVDSIFGAINTSISECIKCVQQNWVHFIYSNNSHYSKSVMIKMLGYVLIY